MPFIAQVDKPTFHALLTPPKLFAALQALPLFTELDAIIQTESSQDISVEASVDNVPFLTSHRIGLNTFRALNDGSS